MRSVALMGAGESSSPTLYSFDVFDTLITRPYARPTDLFRQVASAVLGPQASSSDLNAFAESRTLAESRARQDRRDRDDITLTDIFREFARDRRFGHCADQAMAVEIASELDCVVPIRAGIDAVRSLIASGRRVVFVSDMYLPTGVILAMLERAGLTIEPRALYVSGAIGLSKHTGRLFDYVSASEDVAPDDCHHTGDNWRPDVLRPRQRGWRAQLFSGAVLNRFEAPAPHQPRWLATRAGGLSRASRVQCVSGNSDAARIGAGVVAPFLSAYVCDVLLDAERRGLDTLYFVSRDGQIFLKIARALQSSGIAPQIECRYLYGSRQAWFLPPVTEARHDLLGWAWAEGMSTTPRDILRRVEIDPEEVSTDLARLGIRGDRLDTRQNADQLERFVNWLLSPGVGRLIVDRATARRRTLMSYVKEQGLLDRGRRYATVDVGWTLMSQEALRRCMQAEGYDTVPQGYFLGVIRGHVPLVRAGEARAFIGFADDEVSQRAEARWFFRLSTILLVEHLFTLADHPSLARFVEGEDGTVPDFKPDYRNAELISFTRHLHLEIESYAGLAGGMLGLELASDGFIAWALENVRRFACDPLPADVVPVAWLPTNREQTHDPKHFARLASPLTLSDIFRMALHDLMPPHESHFSPDFAWNAGAAAISPAVIRGLYWTLSGLGQHVGTLRRALRDR